MVSKGQTPAADDQRVGQCRMITPDSGMRNVAYVSWEGTLVALRTKVVDGDLSHLGLTGVNDYNAMWRARDVYGEVERVWEGTDPSIRINPPAEKTAFGIAIPAGADGCVVFGPYLDLDPGNYRLQLVFAPDIQPAAFDLDVSAGAGSVALHTVKAAVTGGRMPGRFETDFTTSDAHRGVEFRLSVAGDFTGELRRISLLRRTERVWAFDDAKIGVLDVTRSATGVVIPLGQRGRVLYGPYARLTAGDYTLRVQFSPETVYSRAMVEVCGREGNAVMHAHTFKQPDLAGTLDPRFDFHLDDLVTDAEFRLVVYGDFDGEFRGYTLEQTGESGVALADEIIQPLDGGQRSLFPTGRVSKLKDLLWRR